MDPRHRDGLLAVGVTVALLVVARATGVSLATLTAPLPFAAGALGALGLELLMAWFPDTSRRLWSQRRVQLLATTLVVFGGGLLAVVAGVWVLTALLGGLIAYFVLLVLVLTGLLPGAETWFDRGA